MKTNYLKWIFALCCLIFISSGLRAQSGNKNEVTVYFKSTSWVLRKYTIVTYTPGETGNGTFSTYWMPGMKRKMVFVPGTKIYLATTKQVGVVMSGNRIDNDPPFLTVSIMDQNKTYSLK